MTQNQTPASFNPVAGSPMLLKPSGTDAKLKTFFVGLEATRYVVVSLAPLLDRLNEFSSCFERGKHVRLFFKRDGTVQGYVVRVQGYTTIPFQHLYLTYPQEGESYNLRQHDRVETHLPGALAGEGVSARCMVSNLSLGGCGVVAHPDHVEAMGRMEIGEHLLLKFQLNTEPELSEVSCQLASLNDRAGRRRAGLRFTYMDERTEKRMMRFIRFVAGHRV